MSTENRWRRAARRLVLATTGVLAGLVGVAALATPAAAHVTVNPSEASQGGYTRIAFRVPNEADSAATTKIEAFLPTDHPIGSVRTMPVPGWTAKVVSGTLASPIKTDDGEITEAPNKITWTADSAGTAIKPGEFLEFPVSLGPLPKTDSLVFKVLQTYSDGSVARWIEEPSGTTEPEHPAPVLTLTKAAGDNGPNVSRADGDAAPPADDDNSPALGIAIAGLVAGLLGLVLGGLAFLRTRGARTG